MEIKYDKEIDAKYVSLKRGRVAHTKKERDWLLFDYDKDGNILGIEILDASKHPMNFHIEIPEANKYITSSQKVIRQLATV